MISAKFEAIGEYGAAGLYEEMERSLFYRKSLGIRRFYESCELAPYSGKLLYPSGVISQNMLVQPHYMWGMDINYDAMCAKDSDLAELLRNDFCKYASTVPPEHGVAGNMYTHSIPYYERIIKEGFLSYRDRIGRIEDADMREGLMHMVEGIEIYIKRCVDYLESAGADRKLIDALGKVPLHPAENIYEAIVGWNFVMYLDNCDNLGCIASGLYPYYHGEDVTDVLADLFDNLDANGGYSMALVADDNSLVLQCLEASKGRRRPMIELLIGDDTSELIWQKAFDVVRTNNGQPAFYNRDAILSGLQSRFPVINRDDVKRFCGGGCTETMIAGMSNVGSLDAGINLLLIFENVIYSKLLLADSFETFYDYYISEVCSVVENVTEQISHSQAERAKYNPLPMRTLLIDDCIDRGVEYNNGGARYMWSIINFAGLINVIDGMLVIRDCVFRDKLWEKEVFVEKLKNGDKALLNSARNHRICFGRNNADADSFAQKISQDIFALLDGKKPYFGEGFLPASIQFMSQADAGRGIGATPDGRVGGAPLCDSLGAIFGKDTEGPTALLKSVASLDLKRALGIPVLNFNINPRFDDGVLKALITGYMKLGGIQLQITCTSAQTLLEAYENPHMHKNLVVRVGGYSEYFQNLSDELKRMIIDRTIQKM